ncbi:hypothetical protein CIB48_g3069 [Xylaria polymorpha]|nr:hypothetical protein CIB48_g3069 [Xylaria polymorpha]
MARNQMLQSLTPADILQAGKPELAGCTFQGPYQKVELDPTATRAELEAPFKENEASIFVHKAELRGADGRRFRCLYEEEGELGAQTTWNGSSQVVSDE